MFDKSTWVLPKAVAVPPISIYCSYVLVLASDKIRYNTFSFVTSAVLDTISVVKFLVDAWSVYLFASKIAEASFSSIVFEDHKRFSDTTSGLIKLS